MKQLITIILIVQTILSFGQENRARLYLKTGVALANFKQNNNGVKRGFVYGYNFGFGLDNKYKNDRKYTTTGELLFIQKGGYNMVVVPTYDQFGQFNGSGSETFPIKLNYLSITSGIKFKISNILYFSIAPRLDYLLSFKSKPYKYNDVRTKKDFQMFTGGLSYSIGILRFKKVRGLFFELQGQNDFFKSGDKKLIGRFYNNYYGINIGFHIAGEKTKDD
jgi:hypothetical protein